MRKVTSFPLLFALMSIPTQAQDQSKIKEPHQSINTMREKFKKEGRKLSMLSEAKSRRHKMRMLMNEAADLERESRETVKKRREKSGSIWRQTQSEGWMLENKARRMQNEANIKKDEAKRLEVKAYELEKKARK